MASTSHLDHIRRAAERDPQDHGAAADLARARARIEGGAVFLEPLADRERWNATPAAVQDLAIEEAERRLAGVVELVGVREWSCVNLSRCSRLPGQRNFTKQSECHECKGTGRVKTTFTHRLATFRHKRTGMELNLLPGAEGLAPFLMGRRPVTSKDWHRGDAGRAGRSPDLPITNLAHQDAAAWCKQLGLVLPTSAQWVHACRAGTTTRFYWGSEMDDGHCWHAGNSATRHGFAGGPCGVCHPDDGCRHNPPIGPRPHAPAEHDSAGAWNAFGLVDMVGNVEEWVSGEEQDGRPSTRGAAAIDSPDVFLAYAPELRRWPSGSYGGFIGFRAALSIPGI